RRLEIPKIDLERQKESIKGVGEIISRMPDLAIAETQRFLRVSKQENAYHDPFDEMNLGIVIKNIGANDASRFKVLLQRKWEWEKEYGSFCVAYYDCKVLVEEENKRYTGDTAEVNGLKAGESKKLYIRTDNAFAPYYDCYIRIILDSGNEVTELDESNNGVSDYIFSKSLYSS
ncbi:MAG: CARDB domain-containing protein, partial [Dissulfurimicrobium sp.]|uniref:CARDB domain-containing protein n=1 Tax=Dissulfurimicrobium sp. TaxID=2022436 RepID=UPI00404AC0C3